MNRIFVFIIILGFCVSFQSVFAISNKSDVNQDGIVNSVDAMLTLRKSLGFDMSATSWQNSSDTGDVNCDSSVTSADSLLLLKYSLGLDLSGTSWCVSDGTGENLLTNTTTYWPVSSITKPNYLGHYIDPIFGTKVTRIVGNPGDAIPNISGEVWPSDQLRHGYSKRQPWNSDESMIFLDRMSPEVWLDGQTYEVLFTRSKPGSRIRWSNTEPNYMYYISSDSKLGKWNVVSDTTTEILDLSGYSSVTFGKGEGNFTWDGKKVAIVAQRDSDSHEVIFVVNVENGTKGSDIDMSSISNEVNNCTISPFGNYIVASVDNSHGSDRFVALDASTGNVLWSENERGVPSHFDVQVDQDGDEVVVGVAKTSVTRNGVSTSTGMIVKRKLANGEMSVISNKKYASHTSGRGFKEPGWVFVTYQDRSGNYTPYVNEVVKVKLDGSEIRRVASLHAIKFNYYSESHAVPSPSGSRVMWASDWETNNYPVQSYVADYR